MTIKIDTFIAPPCDEQIKLLYQDDDLLIIDKPSGLLSLSGKNPLNKDSVHFRLIQDYPSATLVHRLDFGTSGLMVVALNKAVNAHIMKQFQQHSIQKHYIAILAGHLNSPEGIIDFPIAKDIDNFPYQKICMESGKVARSNYQVIEYLKYPVRTRVLFIPTTGRTHQLRVHSREIGHPILGCDLYGSQETHAMADRLLLHASHISFTHPMTNKAFTAECECPF